MGGPCEACAQSTDVNQPAQTTGLTGLRNHLRQLNMGLVKGRLRTMQDGNEVDGHIVLRHLMLKEGSVVHIALQNRKVRQTLNGAGLSGAARDDGDAAT